MFCPLYISECFMAVSKNRLNRTPESALLYVNPISVVNVCGQANSVPYINVIRCVGIPKSIIALYKECLLWAPWKIFCRGKSCMWFTYFCRSHIDLYLIFFKHRTKFKFIDLTLCYNIITIIFCRHCINAAPPSSLSFASEYKSSFITLDFFIKFPCFLANLIP